VRIAGWAIVTAASRSTACPLDSLDSRASAACVVIAPMTTEPVASKSITLSSATRRSPTTSGGSTRPAFIIATSVWPPARQRAPLFSASAATASPTVNGST
jgi:hypothetical protein